MIIIDGLAYSLHLGSDKNKKNISKQKAKANRSGTTSLSNNSIQNARHLSKIDKHNYRKYDNRQDDIVIVKGSSSLYNDVKSLYKKEFEKSRIEYNLKQIREDRKINDYFTNISNNDKNDLACEIIIELGDKSYWNNKDISFKKRMTSVYSRQVKDLELIVPNFKVASAIIHYDETSPHIHIVGVPVKYRNKNGMSKQIGKSDVFTKESLKTIQDKMRTLCIASFNKEYGLNNTLIKKKKGRNKDILVSKMTDYQDIKKELQKKQEKINLINKESLELDNYSNELNNKLNNLKHTLTNKDNLILTKKDQYKFKEYIEFVNKTNKEFKNIKLLSIALNNIDDKLKRNNKTIKNLTDNNKSLNLKVNELNKSIINKDKCINELKDENYNLKISLEYFKNLFKKLINFINDKLFSKREREKYYDISIDLYTHNIIKDETFTELKENYNYSKTHDSKEKDDFEL